MPKHLHSYINKTGTRAIVTDPLAGQQLATVRRTEGFWEAVCSQTGALLLPRRELARQEAPRRTSWGAPIEGPEISLGEIIRDLRPVLCA